MSNTEYTISCIIRGGNPAFLINTEKPRTFPVKIGKREMVGILKQKIRKVTAPELDAFAAATLILYKIDVDASDMDVAIEQVEAYAQTLTTLNELSPFLRLDEVFPRGPLENMFHILIEVPTGESINSRDARAEKGQQSRQPRPITLPSSSPATSNICSSPIDVSPPQLPGAAREALPC